MEIEITMLQGKVHESFEKINCWRDDYYPFYDILRNDYDNLKIAFDKIEEDYCLLERLTRYKMQDLQKTQKQLDEIKEEIMYKLPSWCVPHGPEISTEDKQDFTVYAEKMALYVQYLLCLREGYSEELKEYINTLSLAKNEIYGMHMNFRDCYIRSQIWSKCSKLRIAIRDYNAKMEDIIGRYMAAKKKDDAGREGGKTDAAKDPASS